MIRGLYIYLKNITVWFYDDVDHSYQRIPEGVEEDDQNGNKDYRKLLNDTVNKCNASFLRVTRFQQTVLVCLLDSN